MIPYYVMTDNSEKRLTEAEWRRLELRRSCAEGNHAPHERFSTYANSVGVYYCECGEFRWSAENPRVKKS